MQCGILAEGLPDVNAWRYDVAKGACSFGKSTLGANDTDSTCEPVNVNDREHMSINYK